MFRTETIHTENANLLEDPLLQMQLESEPSCKSVIFIF